jgi:hypothetical protein
MRKSDIILLCSVLLTALAIFGVCAAFTLGKGETVVVRVDGEEYVRLPLGEDTELLIEGVNGGTNLLVIKDGKAYISEATCPDLVCVHTGSADELKSIVCLPNRVTVSIEK